MNEERIRDIALVHGKTVAQVLLKWSIQQNLGEDRTGVFSVRMYWSSHHSSKLWKVECSGDQLKFFKLKGLIG